MSEAVVNGALEGLARIGALRVKAGESESAPIDQRTPDCTGVDQAEQGAQVLAPSGTTREQTETEFRETISLPENIWASPHTISGFKDFSRLMPSSISGMVTKGRKRLKLFEFASDPAKRTLSLGSQTTVSASL